MVLMDPFMIFWVLLIGIIIGVMCSIFLTHRTAVLPLHRKIDELTKEKHLLSQFSQTIPVEEKSMLKTYPYSLVNFRLIKTPIDGIQFNTDSIVFVQFTRSNTKLTKAQQHIKHLVEQGDIRWFEFKIKEPESLEK